mgnify:CR=1 FL=1
MLKLIIADDERIIRESISKMIDWNSLGIELIGLCSDGIVAYNMILDECPVIVLTDIRMPGLSGLELIEKISQTDLNIQFILLSGFGEFEYAKKAIQYGVSEYLLKPVTAMELTGVIEKMKKKVEQQRLEKSKMDALAQNSEEYRKNKQIIRSKNIEALVNCTTDVNASIERLAEMGIDISAASYRVAIFDIDLYSGMYQLDTEKRQESALMAFVLFNISDEIVTREEAGIAYQEGNNRVGILFQEKWSRNFTSRTKEICHEIQEKTKEVMGFDVSMGIGKWVKKPEELIQSHDMAAQTLQYRYLLGGNLLIDMEEQHPVQEIAIEDDLAELKEAMKTGQKEQVYQILIKIEDSIRQALMEKSRACMYLQQVIRTMDNACEDVSADMDRIREDRDELLRQITDQKFFEDACKVVQKHTDRIFEILSELNTSSSKRQARLAIDYIQKNYMDPDLSLNSICSYLNISTSYFSTIFKDETGETFTEVLIRTRMEKAKELLENTTLKNYEIAEKVGFSDPHYFGISFKKMTGCTPTEYAREKRR